MRTEIPPAVDPTSSLESLADRVEQAAAMILRLREQSARLHELLRERESRCAALEAQLAERPESDRGPEVERRLRAAEGEWEEERRRIASRLEALAKRLEQVNP